MTRAHRTVVTLGVNKRTEVEPGVWENDLEEIHVKAQKQYIWQSRADAARADGQLLKGRFLVRAQPSLKNETIDYLIHDGRKYKISSMTQQQNTHDYIVETGELS